MNGERWKIIPCSRRHRIVAATNAWSRVSIYARHARCRAILADRRSHWIRAASEDISDRQACGLVILRENLFTGGFRQES